MWRREMRSAPRSDGISQHHPPKDRWSYRSRGTRGASPEGMSQTRPDIKPHWARGHGNIETANTPGPGDLEPQFQPAPNYPHGSLPPLGNTYWYADALRPGERFWKHCSFTHRPPSRDLASQSACSPSSAMAPMRKLEHCNQVNNIQ